MKNTYEQQKKDFSDLKLLDDLIILNQKEKKIQNILINMFGLPAFGLIALSFVSVLLICSNSDKVSQWYLLPTILLGILPIVTLIYNENKLMKYLRKNQGYTYYQYKLIDILKQADNQKTIISYFNNVVQKYNNLNTLVNNIKTAFAKNDYDGVIEQLPTLLNNINYYENKTALEEQNEIERKEFEKKIGIENNNKNEQVEIEYNGQLKKYL